MSAYDVTLDETTALVADLESRYPVDLWIHPVNRLPAVRISTIRVQHDRNREGIGSQVMEELTRWADANGSVLVLTPASQGRGFPSKTKLKSWYRRFGFVPNKGRNKDYLYMDTMIRRPQAKANPTPLPTSDVDEYGARFVTGDPVTFRFARNTQKAPPPSSEDRFQQLIEPTGIYLLHIGPHRPPHGWTSGTATLHRPLVLPFNLGGYHRYDAESWKAVLSNYYGAKGKALTNRLREDGYDAVVTTGSGGGTEEIVVLEPSAISLSNPGLRRRLMR